MGMPIFFKQICRALIFAVLVISAFLLSKEPSKVWYWKIPGYFSITVLCVYNYVQGKREVKAANRAIRCFKQALPAERLCEVQKLRRQLRVSRKLSRNDSEWIVEVFSRDRVLKYFERREGNGKVTQSLTDSFRRECGVPEPLKEWEFENGKITKYCEFDWCIPLHS